MSEEKPSEPPSAPRQPGEKKSGWKRWLLALLLGFAGLTFLGALWDPGWINLDFYGLFLVAAGSILVALRWGLLTDSSKTKVPKKQEGPSMVRLILVFVGIAACVPLIYLCVMLVPLIVYFFQVIFGG